MSVYNPNEHAFLPGLHGIPKTQEEEDPHTYAYIDDTLVYCHLLQDDPENEKCKEPSTDESGPPLSGPPLPDRPVSKAEIPVTKGSTMVDNEVYGYIQGQSTTSGSLKSPVKTSEEGAYETRLCV